MAAGLASSAAQTKLRHLSQDSWNVTAIQYFQQEKDEKDENDENKRTPIYKAQALYIGTRLPKPNFLSARRIFLNCHGNRDKQAGAANLISISARMLSLALFSINPATHQLINTPYANINWKVIISSKLSKPQLNCNTASSEHNWSFVWHKNDFAPTANHPLT